MRAPCESRALSRDASTSPCAAITAGRTGTSARTSRSAGVPKAVEISRIHFPTTIPRRSDSLLASAPGQFAAVIMEPVNFNWPAPGYLEGEGDRPPAWGAADLRRDLLRVSLRAGGAQQIFGVKPDLATFGKAMGNGWPISCIVGRRDVMEVSRTCSSALPSRGDVAAMAAAMKVLDILESGEAYARMTAAGHEAV